MNNALLIESIGLLIGLFLSICSVVYAYGKLTNRIDSMDNRIPKLEKTASKQWASINYVDTRLVRVETKIDSLVEDIREVKKLLMKHIDKKNGH